MKILQVTNRVPYPPRDGGAIGIYNFARNYHKLGAKLTMLALNTWKHYVSPQDLPEKGFLEFGEMHFVEANTDLNWWDALINLFTKESYNVTRFDKPAVHEKLTRILQEETFDIVHLDGIFVCVYLDTIRRNSKAKIVMRAHNVEHLIWQRMANATAPGPQKWYFDLLVRRLRKYELEQTRRLDALLPISGHDAGIFQKAHPNLPLHITPAGVEMDFFPTGRSQVEFPSIFHLGSLDWRPNLEGINWFLEKVWPVLSKQIPELKFYIAGRNMPGWLAQKSVKNVEMVGEVEDAVRFMRSKAVMVVPLLSGSGMRIKILEGMALEKCIVSTPVGAEGIDHKDGENLFIALDAEGFVKQLIKILKNRSLMEQTGQNARKLVESEYANRAIVKKLLQFYGDLMHAKDRTEKTRSK